MGAFSKVSGIVSPDVAPLTTVKRRLVVFALELGTQYGDTSVLVSWPSTSVFFSLIFSHPHVIFSARHFPHNSGHQFTFPGLSRRRFGHSHFHVQRSKFTLVISCASVFCFSISLSLSLIPYSSLQSFPFLDQFILVASALSPRYFHKLM